MILSDDLTYAERVFWAGLFRTHHHDSCAGRACPIHAPSPHLMRGWPLHWRTDRGIAERLCPHGIGHPDPDQDEYWASRGEEWQSIHGCDGCCSGALL